MLRLLHLYAFTPLSQFLPLGLVWHGRVPLAYTNGSFLSLSFEATLAFPRTMYLAPSKHRTRIQYMVCNIPYVREG